MLASRHYGQSLTALGLAAHEAGHVLQDATGYPLLGIRNGLVPLGEPSPCPGLFILAGGTLVVMQSLWGGPVLLLGMGASRWLSCASSSPCQSSSMPAHVPGAYWCALAWSRRRKTRGAADIAGRGTDLRSRATDRAVDAAVLLHVRDAVGEGSFSVKSGLLSQRKGNTSMIEWLTKILYDFDLTWSKVLWGLGLYLVTFLGSTVVVAWLVIRLPATYFCDAYPRDLWAMASSAALDRLPAQKPPGHPVGRAGRHHVVAGHASPAS